MEELKKLIRSLALPHRNGIRVADLLDDYRHVEGKHLEFERFGFASQCDLLRAIQDCVRVSVNGDNPSDHLVFAVSDEHTSHIHQLVCEQKNQNKSALQIEPNVRALYDSNRFHRSKRALTFTPYSLQNNAQNDNHDDSDANPITGTLVSVNGTTGRCGADASQRSAVCPLPNNRLIPAPLRLKIRALMSEFYEGINLINFLIIYCRKFDERLDVCRYGYIDLEEFLKDMPDIVRLERSPDNVWTVKRVIANHINENINGSLNGSINGISISDKSRNEQIRQNNGTNISQTIPRKELERFRLILKMHSKGITVSNFIDEYERRYQMPLTVNKWGFGSPIEMFHSLQSVFHIQKRDNCDDLKQYILFECETQMFKVQRITTQSFKRINKFDNVFKTRATYIVKKITEELPNSCFFVEDFPNAYYIVYDEKINAEDMGFKCIKDLFMALSYEADIDVKEKIKNKPYLIYKCKPKLF